MKKQIFLIATAISIIGMASCNKNIDEHQVSKQTQYSEVDMSFNATLTESESKTELQSDGKHIFWSPNDSINIFQGSTGYGKFTATNTSVCETATFTGTMNVATGSIEKDPEETYFWAVYPYREDCVFSDGAVSVIVPDIQTAVKGGFESGVFPAIAKSNSMNLAFRNVCGGIEFTVSQSGINQVIFSGNNGENIAGKAMVSVGENGFPIIKSVTDGKKTVIINAPEGQTFETNTKYYVVLFPSELSNGFSMSFAKSDNEGQLKTNSAVTIKRSVFATLEKPDSKAVIHYFIDLGLSVKWAECNVGASTPNEAGAYFAWGETSSKEYYSANNYKHFRMDTTILKYNTLEKYGVVDNKTTLEAEDDAATANLGTEWRTPTLDEWKELKTYCNLSEDVVDGVKGFRLTSKITGYTDKSIFLPIGDGNISANYISSTLHPKHPCSFRSASLRVVEKTIWLDWFVYRGIYSRVRPVTKNSDVSNSVDLGLSVNWSSVNLGASKPSEIGDTYCWGTTEKGVSKKYVETKTNILKYSETDGLQTLVPEDDAATVNLGVNWKMPTKTQFKELIDNCTWEWIENGDEKGLKATSKKSGYTDKSIYFKATGTMNEDGEAESLHRCIYPTSDVRTSNFIYSYYFSGRDTSQLIGSDGIRRKGHTIRPVYVK